MCYNEFLMKDKYTATWVSHSSMSDYLKCPRAYYLKNVYRDPGNNHKLTLMQPALALGQVVHEVIESLSILPVEDRFAISLREKFDHAWARVSGHLGGFHDTQEEEKYKNRGVAMVSRVQNNPGPLLRKAVKLRQDLPYFWISEEDNIILCGKIDWLEYIEDSDSVGILDFKTGKLDEDTGSLQLPIYYLLAGACQTRQVSGLSYWYVDRDDVPTALPLQDAQSAKNRVLEVARRVALARKLGRFVCKHADGCSACRPLEMIIAGNARLVGVNDFGQDLYVL